MKKNIELGAVMMVLASAACSTPAPEENASQTQHEEAASDDIVAADSNPAADDDLFTMEVDDLDGDGAPEKFTAFHSACDEAGCTWSIVLSSLGHAGMVVAQTISPLPQGSLDAAAGFFAYVKGPPCQGELRKYSYVDGAYRHVGTIDCNEVINRPAKAPISQFEFGCFDKIPVECRGL